MYAIAFFTKAGTPQNGLSATITITDLSDDSVIVNGAAMTHSNNGIYKYNFTAYNYKKEYSYLCDGSATLTDAERYKFAGNLEPNSAFLQTGGGGGMVVQYPTKVISKKEEKFKKEIVKLLEAIQLQLELLSKKDNKAGLNKINKNMTERIKELLDLVSDKSEKQEKNVDEGINRLIKNGENTHKEYMQGVADFTDNIYQLQENTKILPNSLNSQLLASERVTTSKFSSIGNEISKMAKKLDELETHTSKFSKDELTGIKKLKEEITSKLSNLQSQINDNTQQIPKFITQQIQPLSDTLKDNHEILIGYGDKIDNFKQEKIKKLEEQYNELASINQKELGGLIKDIIKQIKQFAVSVPNKEEFLIEIRSLWEKSENIQSQFNSFQTTNDKGLKKIHDMLPKLSQKRDLSYTIDSINQTIKELQANNTKKIKVLRDNIDNVAEDLKTTRKKQTEQVEGVIKQIKDSNEESELSEQLRFIDNEKEDE